MVAHLGFVDESDGRFIRKNRGSDAFRIFDIGFEHDQKSILILNFNQNPQQSQQDELFQNNFPFPDEKQIRPTTKKILAIQQLMKLSSFLSKNVQVMNKVQIIQLAIQNQKKLHQIKNLKGKMGCVNSSQISNENKQLPKIYIQIIYGASCGWAKPLYKFLRLLQSQIPAIPVNCLSVQKQNQTLQVFIIKNSTPTLVYTGSKQEFFKEASLIIESINAKIKEKTIQKPTQKPSSSPQS